MLRIGIVDHAPMILAAAAGSGLLAGSYGLIKGVLLFVVWVSGLYKLAKFFVTLGTAEASSKGGGLMKMAMLAATLVVATWFIGGTGIGTMQSLVEKIGTSVKAKVDSAPGDSVQGCLDDAKDLATLRICLKDGAAPTAVTCEQGKTLNTTTNKCE